MTGTEALKIILPYIQRRNTGPIFIVAPFAHRALQAMEGYKLLKRGHLEIVCRHFPTVYDALSALQADIPTLAPASGGNEPIAPSAHAEKIETL